LKPRVTILLASYNGEKFIAEQIDSIFNQNGIDINLLISDDCSSDKTLSILINKQKFYKNKISIISTMNNTGMAGRNFYNLIMKCNIKSEYYALADQDDIWLPNKIINLINCMELSKSDVASSDVIALYNNNKTRVIKKSHPQKKYDYLFEAAGPGCSYIFRKNFFEKLQLFIKKHIEKINTFIAHDLLIYAYARKNFFKWIIAKDDQLLYRQHDNNVLGANVGAGATFKRLSIIFSGEWLRQVNILLDLLNFNYLANNNLKLLFFCLKNIFCLRRQMLFSISIPFIIIFSIVLIRFRKTILFIRGKI